MAVEDLLNLPVEIQISLASGYISYALSYTGIRRHHSSLDTLFVVIIYSAITNVILRLASNFGLIGSAAIALISTAVSALSWRVAFRGVFYKLLRHLNFTWSTDDPSALFTLYANTSKPVLQLSVELLDGQILECRDTSQFSDAPFGPCLIGPNGDVGLYVTNQTDASGGERELKNARNADYGDLITYIPASQIKFFAVRHLGEK